MAELLAERVPFVQATVVRAQAPTSARPGDAAVVLRRRDHRGLRRRPVRRGVGAHRGARRARRRRGRCCCGSCRRARRPSRTTPGARDGGEPVPVGRGHRGVPRAAAARRRSSRVVGTTPIADAVAELAEPLGFAVARRRRRRRNRRVPTAVVISSHGRDEERVDPRRPGRRRAASSAWWPAARAAPPCSTRSGSTDDERAASARRSGVDIGARTAEEIALSIVAELVRAVRVEGLAAAGADAGAAPPARRSTRCAA